MYRWNRNTGGLTLERSTQRKPIPFFLSISRRWRLLFDIQDVLEELMLQGRADGVDLGQVEAKLELECADVWAYYLNEQDEVNDLLQGILNDLEEDLGN